MCVPLPGFPSQIWRRTTLLRQHTDHAGVAPFRLRVLPPENRTQTTAQK